MKAAWEVAAEAGHRLEEWKARQDESGSGQVPPLNATAAAFAKVFKTLIKEQSVPENVPYAQAWKELERTRRVPASVKKIRGSLNVPCERFWTNQDGEYRVARFG